MQKISDIISHFLGFGRELGGRLFPDLSTIIWERYGPGGDSKKEVYEKVYEKRFNLGCFSCRKGQDGVTSLQKEGREFILCPFIHKNKFLDYKARHQKTIFSRKRIFVIDCEFQLRKKLDKHQFGAGKGIAGRLLEIPSSPVVLIL